MSEKGVAIASLCLKVNIVTLTGDKKSAAQREEEADLFLGLLSRRLEAFRQGHSPTSSPKKKGMASSTVVPFFDIEYQAIIEFLEGHPLNRDLELAEVEKRLPLFREMFGLSGLKAGIVELQNQSVVPLGSLLLLGKPVRGSARHQEAGGREQGTAFGKEFSGRSRGHRTKGRATPHRSLGSRRKGERAGIPAFAGVRLPDQRRR